MRATHLARFAAASLIVGLSVVAQTPPTQTPANAGTVATLGSPGMPAPYPGQTPRPFPRLVGPETLNPGPFPEHWPYPDEYNSVSAAPEVHHLRYTDAKLNFVEVAYFPGVHGQMHGHPFPSVFAVDAPAPKSVDERLDPDRMPKISRSAPPTGMSYPICVTMGPESPHAETNLDTWPHHFYRIEFKRVDDVGIQKNWRTWYPRMLDPPLVAGKIKTSSRDSKLSDAWPYPVAYHSILAAPNNYKLLYEDSHVRFVEVTLRPGETEPMHGDPYPSVIAMDAISGVTPGDRFMDAKSPLNGQSTQHAGPPPPQFTSPSCSTTGPRAPHAMTNSGTVPLHYYRIEFKRIDGPALKDNWRQWYPWMATITDETAKNPFRPNY